MIEHKAVALKGLNVLDDDEGIIETFVSVTGIVDNVNDVIEPGAYTKTLKDRTPKGVWSHDWDTPVSKTLEAKELMPGSPDLPTTMPDGSVWPAEAGALLVKTQFNLGTQRGREAYSDVVFFGTDQEWSIGYQVPRGQATKSANGPRRIKGLDLYEYSPVLFGAMTPARTRSVKDAQLAIKSLNGEDVDAFMLEHKGMFDDILKRVEEKSGKWTGFEPDAEDEEEQEEKDLISDEMLDAISSKGWAIVPAAHLAQFKAAWDLLGTVLTESGIDLVGKAAAQTAEFDIEGKSFMDLLDEVDEAGVLDQKTIEDLVEFGEPFDDAVTATDEKGMVEASKSIIDTLDEAMDDSESYQSGAIKALVQNVESTLKSFKPKANMPEDEDPDADENDLTGEDTDTGKVPNKPHRRRIKKSDDPDLDQKTVEVDQTEYDAVTNESKSLEDFLAGIPD